MHRELKESDWKRFRTIVPELRERYLTERNKEVIALLGDESSSPTERFWAASERMKEIETILRTCLDHHSRSRMIQCVVRMHQHRMLTDDDLQGFSDELRERVACLVEIFS